MRKQISMIRLIQTQLVLGLLSGFALLQANAEELDEKQKANWHQFRGPLATGEALNARPPVTWDAETNIKWKVEVPGVGSSTPIVWEDKVFVITAVPTGEVDESLPAPEDQPQRPFNITFPNQYYSFDVICYDRASGEIKWQKSATKVVPPEGTHPDNDFASATPTTDGERLYVSFGTQGFYCFDLDGNEIWKRDLGPAETRLSFGEGTSLTVHEGKLIVLRDQEGQSAIHVLDAKSGETIWSQDRDEPTAWATPLVVEHNGVTQVITNASNFVRSYDLRNGELIWKCSGQVANVTPSPVHMEGAVYCMSGYRGYSLYSISLDAKGDVSGDESGNDVRWAHRRSTPYISSPLLYDGKLYFVQSLGSILSCVDAASGETLIAPTRIEGVERVYASPVAANGMIYLTGRDGTTVVLDANDDEFKPVATNVLDDPIDASLAIVGDQIFARGKEYLYCIEE